ncbi:MAG TPA: CRISPR-associated protein [Anaerolineae bacterium]|nr:CRISPR-associated protein [Anaerolineae bacterium]
MIWSACKVRLRLLTPMHIGQSKQGNLQRTRPYVHGRALWGALTARITRDNSTFDGDYQAVGKRVNDELAFSYFYPATEDRVDCWPWEDAGRFAWSFLGSYTGTALEYSRNAAAEGSLHETEFIAPTTRDGRPVCLIGYIFARTDCSLLWEQALNRLQIGGERTYGWGRVVCDSCLAEATTLFGRYALDLRHDRPVVTLEAGNRLLAHAHAYGDGAISATGRVLPLVGRETRAANAHGRHYSQAVVCWEPGSVVKSAGQVVIGPYGIWEAVSP